jgi:hypothetical protein
MKVLLPNEALKHMQLLWESEKDLLGLLLQGGIYLSISL